MSRTKPKPRAPTAPTIPELKDILRKAGMRSTAPRVAALRYLHGAGTPASHADLFVALEAEGFDRVTLYRNLTDLAEAGLVTRTDLGDHVWRFELKRSKGAHSTEHPHFVCSDCGEVSCLPGVAVKVVSTARAPRSVAGKEIEVRIKGLCDGCA